MLLLFLLATGATWLLCDTRMQHVETCQSVTCSGTQGWTERIARNSLSTTVHPCPRRIAVTLGLGTGIDAGMVKTGTPYSKYIAIPIGFTIGAWLHPLVHVNWVTPPAHVAFSARCLRATRRS